MRPSNRVPAASALMTILVMIPVLENLARAASPGDVRPVVLYEFNGKGNTIIDSSDNGQPLNLTIEDPKQLKRTEGSIELLGKTKVQSLAPATKLITAIKRSQALSVEIWLRTSDPRQSGPARIVTLSKDASNRNLTVGQDGDKYDVRLRSAKTSGNGIPSLASPKNQVRTALTHVVYTRAKSGQTGISVNGKRVASGKAAGSLESWDAKFRFSLGDEISGGRPWKGILHRVAIYDSELSPADIQKRFSLGPNGALIQHVSPAELARRAAVRHFESKVAPLLSRQCLECHDTSTLKGDLDLARKETALASVVAGNPDESDLWLSVESDAMPHDRPPLSAAEKQVLKQWIRDGAVWSLDWIDPAVYLNETGKRENFVRRLTLGEYVRSVQAAVDVDITERADELLPKDLRADGFRNTAYNLTVDLKHIEAYNRLAEEIVSQMDVRSYAKRFWSKPRVTDKDMRGLIQEMGRWILRGDLYDDEIVLYRGISTTVIASGGDYEDAVAATIRAMLISPRFLYRIENQIGDGGKQPLSGDELSTRIAYAIWGAPPDAELRKSARDGGLLDPSALRKQVLRMMDDPRAADRSADFISQWLNLDHLDSLRPDTQRFPNWNASLARDMRHETLAFFEHVVWEQKRPLSDLLSAQVTFLTPALAKHYGLKPQASGAARYDLEKIPERGGLITHGSVLTIGGDDASMVTRGLLVLQQLLRGVVNDPPPCVDTTPVPTASGLSQRKIAEARIADESCGGCHGRFEPLAFGLEKFDGLGSFHDQDEHGNRLRDDGEILFPGTGKPVSYRNASELMKLLSESDRVRESLVWKLAQFAVGRPLLAEDAGLIREIHQKSKAAGGRYQDILAEIVMSDLVTHIRTSPTEP